MVHVGLLGAGSIVDYHIRGFRQAGASVDAVCDVAVDRAKAVAEKYNIKNVYSSLDEMLEKETGLDAVSILLPNAFHCSSAIKCLEKGKHVYCEKPPALNAKEMQSMLDAAKKSGCLLMFDFNNRARPEAIALKEYFLDGTMGHINSAEAVWSRRNGIPGFGGWFTNKELSGGGPVIDLPHMLDLALYLMDYPEPSYVLSAVFNDFMGNPLFKGPWGIPDRKDGVCNVESSAHAFVRFKNGSCLYIHNGWAEMVERERVSVSLQGTKSGCELSRLFEVDGIDETSIDECKLFTLEHNTHVDRKLKVIPDVDMGRVTNASYFIDSIEGRRAPINTPEEALTLMKIIDALYESANTGKPVEIRM